MDVIKEGATLQGLNKKGTYKYWQAILLNIENTIYLQTIYWSTNKDGSISDKQYSEPTLVKSKHNGKKNETTPLDQGIKELEALTKRQLDKGYFPIGTVVNTLCVHDSACHGFHGTCRVGGSLPLPMLAQEYNKQLRNVMMASNLYTQPKLDGVRMLFDGGKGWSRLGKQFIPEVIQHLLASIGEYVLDGELILPQPYSFQDTISAVKKYQPTLSHYLEYHVFDLVIPHKPFKDRLQCLRSVFGQGLPANIKLVPTTLIARQPISNEVSRMHSNYIMAGYEGSIIRYPEALYTVGYRSKYLLKHKDFDTGEYQVIDIREGNGSDKGAIIYECLVPGTTLTFNCRPSLPIGDRKGLYQQGRDTFINKMLTVKYQGLSDMGIPRFPVGIAIRDYEDS